jgi:biopolymer transport protein ExbB/TolQ
MALAKIALTVLLLFLFYAATPVWGLWPRLYEILFERGVWPYFIIAVAMLAVGELLMKAFLCWKTKPLDLHGVNGATAGPLASEELAKLARHLKGQGERGWLRGHSVWSRRLGMGLLQFARGESKESIRNALETQAEIDEASLGLSYTLVKLYLWALPLLGFIGTVEGIGAGIGEFSMDLREQTRVEAPDREPPIGDQQSGPNGTSPTDRVRSSLEKVTAGLGRAFDTTYLALVLAVVLMLSMSMLEKHEMDRQLSFDEDCQMNFVARLPSAGGMTTDDAQGLTATVSAFRKSVEEVSQAAERLSAVSQSIDRATELVSDGINVKLTLNRGS